MIAVQELLNAASELTFKVEFSAPVTQKYWQCLLNCYSSKFTTYSKQRSRPFLNICTGLLDFFFLIIWRPLSKIKLAAVIKKITTEVFFRICVPFTKLDALLTQYSRFQWPHGLRRSSSAARLLRLWVRIPPGAWMFVVSVVCCQVEVSATDWTLVQRSPTDCGTSLCVIKKPRKRGS